MTGAALMLCVVLLPAAGAAASLVVPERAMAVTALLEVAVLGVALALLALAVQGPAIDAFDHWLHLDGLSGVVLLVVAIVSVLAAVYSAAYMRHELHEGIVRGSEVRRYFAVLHLFVLTMVAVTVAGNLGLLWTAISATTLASAPLVHFYGSREPLEAAWKYLVLTVAGSLIALLGFLILYQAGVGPLGPTYNFSVAVVAGAAAHLSPLLAGAAFLLVLVGFGTKAGLAPMHAWLPDAHSQAPSPVCAMLSGAELNCALLGIFRVYALAAPAAGGAMLRTGLVVFGVASMLVGIVFLISQRDFKRLLAYSSIEQMGLISLGVGLGTPVALLGALLLVVAHGLTKSLLFFATGNLLLRFRTTAIGEVHGVIRTMPWTAILLIGGALAIAGAPPFGVFIADLSIVSGAFAGHLWALGALTGVLMVTAFVPLVLPFHSMTFSPGARTGGEVGALALAPAFALLGAVLVLGVWVPGPLEQLLHSAMTVLPR